MHSHRVGGEESREIINDWVRLGRPIEHVPGSHFKSSAYVPHHPALRVIMRSLVTGWVPCPAPSRRRH